MVNYKLYLKAYCVGDQGKISGESVYFYFFILLFFLFNEQNQKYKIM